MQLVVEGFEEYSVLGSLRQFEDTYLGYLGDIKRMVHAGVEFRMWLSNGLRDKKTAVC